MNKCYDCKYCRAKSNENKIKYDILPEYINSVFSKIPIVINMFYGDPLLQVEKTKSYLKRLEDAKHQGIVLIITKGKIGRAHV